MGERARQRKRGREGWRERESRVVRGRVKYSAKEHKRAQEREREREREQTKVM